MATSEQRHSLEVIVGKINAILRGWYGYFKHASAYSLAEMDGWVRNRLRGILRKRRKGRGHARGRDNHRWPNRYFDTLGLFNLEAAREMEHSSLRLGANLLTGKPDAGEPHVRFGGRGRA